VPGATDTEADLRRLLETDPGSLLLAEDEGRIVGGLIAAWDGWRGNLYRLAVLPSHRRRGVARALLEEGERRLRDKGAVRVSVLAIGESEAPEVWTALGYGFDKRIQRFVKTLVAALALVLIAGCGSSEPKKDTDPALAVPTTKTEKTAPSRTTTTPETAPVPRPDIVQKPIPFGEKRKEETAAYAERHYGTATDKLDPKLIVEHVSVTPTFQAVYDTFASDQPDVELHELPNVCSHFVVDRDGTIYQLVSLKLICRHTVGLNDHAIGIEHVGETDADILGDSAQLDASLKLTRWLRCRYGISVGNVIGHNESLSSPYHHERVASLRNQTHSDWTRPDMDRYRARLRKLPC
jgi:beta-N-acetylhexosaminidase